MAIRQTREKRPAKPDKQRHMEAYEIRTEGKLDPAWAEWLPGMKVTFDETDSDAAETVIRGWLPDQSSLRGILGKLWDLGATVTLVKRQPVETDERRFSQ
jgi:hypothetical protein